MPKPSPAWPAHRQDTVISILVAGTLRSEAPLSDMAGRLAGAAAGCETGAAGAARGGGGVGPCAAAALAAEAALPPALRALLLLAPSLWPAAQRLQMATQPRPALRVAPTPLEQPRAGQEPYTDSNSNPQGGRVLPARFPGAKPSAPPPSPRAVPEAEGFQIPGGRWGRFLFLSRSLNLLLLPTPVLPPSVSEELHICVTLGKLLNVSVAQSVH